MLEDFEGHGQGCVVRKDCKLTRAVTIDSTVTIPVGLSGGFGYEMDITASNEASEGV